jgi:predicted aspartyl protease
MHRQSWQQSQRGMHVHPEGTCATAGGVVDMTVYTGIVSVLDTTFEVEFIFSPIPDSLPFTFLIGRNLLDQLDAYFLGKKQVLLLKIAEPKY